jgi:outer membrane protein OmpA-like peptidoglycan-associated protein
MMRLRTGYVVCAAIAIGGVAAGIFNVVHQLRGIAGGLQQVVVPGDHDIALTHVGRHTIFHEERAVVGGRYFASDRELSGVKLRLQSLPAGREIALDAPAMRTQYSLADRAGSSIATFRIETPGTYRLSAWYPDSDSNRTAVLAIGYGIEHRLLLATVGSFGIVGLATIASAAIAIATYVRGRRQSQRHAGNHIAEEADVKAKLVCVMFALLVAGPAFAQGQPAQQKPVLASVDSRWGNTYCDLTELARTGTAELSVRYRYRNVGEESLTMPHVNLVPRTRVFDPVSRTLFGVMMDSSGKPVTSTMLDGQAARPIPAHATHAHWARFQAPPENVTSVTVLIEGCQPFDDIPIGGSASAAPRATPTPAIASQDGEADGLVVDVTSVTRTSGGFLSVAFRYRYTGTDRHNFPHAPTVRGAYYLDSQNRKKYEVARNQKKEPLCSEPLNLAFPAGETLEPGESMSFWAKFGAPPASTKTVALHVPFAPPFDDVPIAGADTGSGGTSTTVAGSTIGVETALKDLNAKVTPAEIRIELSADVLFDFDKADIKKEAEPSLQKLATVLNANPGAKVEIEGHTDGKGADDYNQTLSELRAASVKRWLVANAKVPAASVATRGWGKTKPVAHNTKPDGSDDPDGRAKNRRVEIVVRKGA